MSLKAQILVSKDHCTDVGEGGLQLARKTDLRLAHFTGVTNQAVDFDVVGGLGAHHVADSGMHELGQEVVHTMQVSHSFQRTRVLGEKGGERLPKNL